MEPCPKGLMLPWEHPGTRCRDVGLGPGVGLHPEVALDIGVRVDTGVELDPGVGEILGQGIGCRGGSGSTGALGPGVLLVPGSGWIIGGHKRVDLILGQGFNAGVGFRIQAQAGSRVAVNHRNGRAQV